MFEHSDHADMHLGTLEPRHLRSGRRDVPALLLFLLLLPLDAECDVMNVKEKGHSLSRGISLTLFKTPVPKNKKISPGSQGLRKITAYEDESGPDTINTAWTSDGLAMRDKSLAEHFVIIHHG